MDAVTKHDEANIAEHLVERMLAGDRSAEEEMVKRYHRGLLVALVNRSKDESIAQDIAQETWAIVIENLRKGKLRNKQKLAAFISQTGRNRLIMFYRKSKRHQYAPEETINTIPDEKHSPAKNVENLQLKKAIQFALESMNIERDSQILSQFYINGVAKIDLCDQYELTSAHFDRVLHRARNRFKEVWAKQNANH